MKRVLFVIFHLPYVVSLLFGSPSLNILDKSHVKSYTDSWVNIWRNNPTPLSTIRINEAWKTVIWCTENKNRDNCYSFTYREKCFLLLITENVTNRTLHVMGILENPENDYTQKQSKQIHDDLSELSHNSNCTLDYSPLRNWSHGFYFYEFQT